MNTKNVLAFAILLVAIGIQAQETKKSSKTNKKPESWRKEKEHFKNWLKEELGHLPIKKISAFNLEKIKKSLGGNKKNISIIEKYLNSDYYLTYENFLI